MEQKAKTRALLAAFGCALTYLLAAKCWHFCLPRRGMCGR